jgi:hypothetical protein
MLVRENISAYESYSFYRSALELLETSPSTEIGASRRTPQIARSLLYRPECIRIQLILRLLMLEDGL